MFLRRILFHLSRYRGFFNRNTLSSVIFALLVVIASGTVIVLFFERGQQSGLDHPSDVAWWIISTLTGIGTSSGAPRSLGGRVFATGLMLFGVVLVGMFTGTVVSMIIDSLLKEGQGMGISGYKGHVIICGWNPTARVIVEELIKGSPPQSVVILADMDRSPVRDGRVYFVRGDPCTGEDLKRAGIMDAASAIIFPTSRDAGSADSSSLLVALAIESLSPKCYTCVEVLDPRNEEHFRYAHADEVIVATEMAAHMLARATTFHGLSKVVSDLLSADNGNEFYKVPLDAVYHGQTFDAVLSDLRTRAKAILLGIERDGTLIINPKDEVVVQTGDMGLVVGWEEPRPARLAHGTLERTAPEQATQPAAS